MLYALVCVERVYGHHENTHTLEYIC